MGTYPRGESPALHASITSAASRRATDSAIGLRQALPRQTKRTFFLRDFSFEVGCTAGFFTWKTLQSLILACCAPVWPPSVSRHSLYLNHDRIPRQVSKNIRAP